MKARLLFNRKFERDGGYIIQQKVWRLPERTEERPHGLKYSLYFGKDGQRLVAYDNERGKGDHRHYGKKEEAYDFTTLEKLFEDFENDVRRYIE